MRTLLARPTEASTVAGRAGFVDLSEGKGAEGFANGSGVGGEGRRGPPVALGLPGEQPAGWSCIR